MSMYKRPPLRVREAPRTTHSVPGTFLHTIINPGPTEFCERVKQPIYRKDDYLALLERSCKEAGIPFKKPDIPDYEDPVNTEIHREPHIDYVDHVSLRLKILKSGIIRVKLDTSIATLYEKYYSQIKQPPMKSVIQAYKSLGFSEAFLEKTKKNFTKKAEYRPIVEKIIERVFEKEPVKKPKKKKEDEVVAEEEVAEDEDDEEQDEDLEDDEGMDVEVEEDPDEQPQEEEEYFSDGGD